MEIFRPFRRDALSIKVPFSFSDNFIFERDKFYSHDGNIHPLRDFTPGRIFDFHPATEADELRGTNAFSAR